VRDLRTDPYILCVGRLDDPRKNVGLLLEAYSLLSAELKSTVRLLLAGAAGPPDEFWRRVDSFGVSGRVSFVRAPDAEALVRLYQNAAVFALPSDEEGLGVVVLEAMACAIPVVATRCGGPEGIIADGVDGYLIAQDDARALSARLVHLLTDGELNHRIGDAGRATILQRYEEGVAGQAFLEMYDELLSRGRAGRLACAG
jgi:glycosyltransferase involved in cell wall biosynthesis